MVQKLLELGSASADTAQARSPFADAGTISVQEQSFSLAFAATGSEGSSDWRPVVDCDADPRKSPMCFAAYTASLDTNKDGKLSVLECEASVKANTDLTAKAVAYQRRDQDSKEDTQFNRRQSSAALASRVVALGQSTINQTIFFDPENQPWYLKPGSRWSNPTFRIVAYVYFGISGFWFLTLFYLRFINKEKSFDGEQALNMTAALQAVALALWFFYDFSIMCARYHWLRWDASVNYEIWSTDYETPDEVVYWLNEDYWKVNDVTHTSHGCPKLTELYFADALPVPDDACSLGPMRFSAHIMRKFDVSDTVETIAQQFSIGFGLFIWPVLYIIVSSMKILKNIWGYPKFRYPPWDKYTIAKQKAQNELDRAKPFCSAECDLKKQCWDAATWVLFFVITFLLGVQQSVVLLPITGARINPYCLVLNIPASQRYGACVHKWSACGLPYGLVIALGGGLLFAIFWGFFVDTKYGIWWRENVFNRHFSGTNFGFRV